MINYTDILEITIKLVLAAILGGLIGLDREYSKRPAGLRTHMLVTLGSAIFMLINLQLVSIYPHIDPGRYGAQVISGIGFLGAGTIIKKGPTISGLTTAAGLWAAAAVGLSVGSGYYVLAIIATVVILIILRTFSFVESKFKYAHKYTSLYIETTDDPDIMKNLSTIFDSCSFDIEDFSSKYNSQKGHYINVKLSCKPEECNDLIDELSKNSKIKKISLR